jgi:hypothetical protein
VKRLYEYALFYYRNDMHATTLIPRLVLSAGLLLAVFGVVPAQSQLRIAFLTQPSNTSAGEAITPAVTVEAQHLNGERDTTFVGSIQLSIQNNPAGGTLSGPTMLLAIDGVAVFNGISIDKAGNNYTLRAQTDGAPPVTSNGFNITPGSPTQLLKISGDGQSGTVNAPLQEPFVIELRDQFDNRVPGLQVEFSIIDQPDGAGASLSTENTQTGQDGRASTILTIGNKAGTYTVQVSTSGLPSEVFTATVQAYTITGSVTVGNTALQGVSITATGGHEQTVTTNTSGNYTLTDVPNGATEIEITPSLSGYIFSPSSRTINGPVTADTTGQDFGATLLTYTITGVVTMDGAALPGVTVTATGGHSQTVTTQSDGVYRLTDVIFGSTNITITPSLEAHDFSPQTRTVSGPVVQDIGGQNFTATLRIYTISGTVSGDTQGDVRISVTGDVTRNVQTSSNGNFNITGVPHGSDITISPTKDGYSFDPDSRSLSNITSDHSNINFTARRWELTFDQQPTNTIAGEVISPAVTVYVVDFDGNVITDFSRRISVSIQNNPGNGTLSGATQVDAVGGIATYSNLSIQRAGNGYTLRASASGLDDVTSNSFNILAGPPQELFIVSGNNQEGTINAQLSDPFVVGVRDQFQNAVSGVSVSFSITSQPENAEASLSDQSGTTDENGRASTLLTLGSTAGTYQVRAEVSGIAPVTFTATLAAYTISGTIRENNNNLSGVTVTASGGFEQAVTTNNAGRYTITGVPRGSENITITPTRDGFAFIPTVILINGPVQNNISGIDFSATQFSYSISGRVLLNGAGLEGVVMSARGGYSATVESNPNGEFTFTNVAHGAEDITITPSLTGFGFNPSTITIEGPVSENIRLDDIQAEVKNFRITGRITHDDIGIEDVQITAEGSYNNSVLTESDGSYEFSAVPFGATDITVTPDKPGYLFEPDQVHLSGPVANNIENINFTAVPPPAPSLSSPENNAVEQKIVLILSWNEVAGAMSYGLEVSGDQSFGGDPHILIWDLEETSYEIRDLERGQTYYWRVNASNLGGTSAWSDVRNFTTTTSRQHLVITAPREGNILRANDSYSISWEAEEIEYINIEYSLTNGATWNMIASSVDAGTQSYLWTVPQTTAAQCRIKISNAEDPLFYELSSMFSIYPATVPVQHSIAFNDPGSITSYRMVGLPGNSSRRLSQVLPGEPNRDWTVYYDNGHAEDYLIAYDGSTRFTFSPGRGFWILSKTGFTVQDEVETVPLHDDHTYSIPLHDGWNIISNPFEIPVIWDEIRQINDIAETLWYFNGHYIESDNFEPYKGYYFFNRTDRSMLKIPYPYGMPSARIADRDIHDPRTVTFSLVKQGKRSKPVRIHILDKGMDDADKLRKYAPPGDFEEATIVLKNDELPTDHSYLTEDVNDTIAEGYSFPIKLVSRSEGQFDLLIEGLESIDDHEVRLIDTRTGKHYEVGSGVLTNILPRNTEREFVILIGTHEFVQRSSGSYIPTDFYLSDNYPNPFNPTTVIEYSIPEVYDNIPVLLDVYNVLGQKVRTLVDDIQNSGFYTVRWDGTNEHGTSVASGLYIYVLRAGDFTDRKKMMLTK